MNAYPFAAGLPIMDMLHKICKKTIQKTENMRIITGIDPGILGQMGPGVFIYSRNNIINLNIRYIIKQILQLRKILKFTMYQH